MNKTIAWIAFSMTLIAVIANIVSYTNLFPEHINEFLSNRLFYFLIGAVVGIGSFQVKSITLRNISIALSALLIISAFLPITTLVTVVKIILLLIMCIVIHLESK